MRDSYSEPQCVVVGIDGSRSAVEAALWAVDEAVDRDIPLRLVYATDSVNSDPGDAAREAAAEHVIRDAFVAIESTGKPVKMEAESLDCRPISALLEASRSAAMVCVGSTGVKHAMQGRIGSTASELAAHAHCPIAIVPTSAGATSRQAGLILAAVDESPASSAVLELGVQEARLRGTALRVVTIRRPQRGDGGHDAGTAADRIHRIEARVEHRLTHWRRNYPDLDIESVPDYHNLLNYLEHLQRTATSTQLVVVDPLQPGQRRFSWGPPVAPRWTPLVARC